MVVQTQPKGRTVEEFDVFIRLPENRERLFEYIGGKIVEVVSNPLHRRLLLSSWVHFGVT